MATEIKLIAQPRDGSGTPKTFDYKPGAKHAADSNNLYKVVVDGNAELPPGTKIVRNGNSVVFNFPDGTHFEIDNWCGVTDSRLTDLTNAQAYSNDESAYVNAKEIESGACMIWGDGGQAAAVLGDGGSSTAAGAAGATSSDGHGTTIGIIGGLLGVGILAAVAGQSGDKNTTTVVPNSNDAPINAVPTNVIDLGSDFESSIADGLVVAVNDPDESTPDANFKLESVTLRVNADQGKFQVTQASGDPVVVTGNDTNELKLVGTETDMNNLLKTLKYIDTFPVSPTDPVRDISISVTSVDKQGAVDTDTITLRVQGLGGSSVGGGDTIGMTELFSTEPAPSATTSHAAPASVSLASLIGDPNDQALQAA
jgi:hypothetical protein